MKGAVTAADALSRRHLEHIRQSAIDTDIIEERGYRTASGKAAVLEAEPRLTKRQARSGGLLIPVYRVGESEPYAHVLRPDNPRTNDQGQAVKYEWPTGIPPCLDVLPRYRAQLTDPTYTLWLTEGAKKADALASVGLVAVNINGVFGWRGKNKRGGKALLADFESIALEGRRCVLAFDGDSATNAQVRQALSRLAAVLVRKGAEVWTLPLPSGGSDGGKVGVDDYLATLPEGDRLATLERAIEPYEAAYTGVTKAFTHPATGEACFHPPGYTMAGDALMFTDPHTERVTTVYNGTISVTALGVDVETGDQTATVRFRTRGGLEEAIVPRADIGQARTLIVALGARGAAVHERNARQLSAYLTEFASLNAEALPYREHSCRLGLVRGDGLVAPARSIGTATVYQGARHLRVGDDGDAYRRALHEVATWPDVWPLWLVLAASLASPAIARLRLRRSPIIYLSGDSGAGKTTAAQFSTGAWCDPEGPPLRVEAGRTTRAGYLQALTEAGGLPVLIDEAHTAARPADVESTAYAFANGQAYSKGTVQGLPSGGEALRGAVLMAGEAAPEFVNAGATRRILYLPAEDYPPLGAAPYSELGRTRAAMLEQAWRDGAGHLGPTVVEAVWRDFAGFAGEVRKAEAYGRLATLGPWAPAIAAVMVTLARLFKALELPVPDAAKDLPVHVAGALEASAERADPAAQAFERLTGMLAQAELDDEGRGLRLGGELIAWKSGERWHIITTGEQLKRRVGESAAQLYGRQWARRGLIELAPDGKSTHVKREPVNRALARVVILAPEAERD